MYNMYICMLQARLGSLAANVMSNLMNHHVSV